MSMGLLMILLIASAASQAQTHRLSDLEVFKRCYIQMTRDVPKPGDALYKAVMNGSKTGPNACIELFDRAQIASNGVLTNQTNQESRNILKTFNDLHRSWFQSKDFSSMTNPGAVGLIFDLEEPALYFTRAALMRDQQFRSIVTHNTGLRGVRVLPSTASGLAKRLTHFSLNYNTAFPYANDPNFLYVFRPTRKNATNFTTLPNEVRTLPNAALVDTGVLIGIASPSPLALPGFYGAFAANGGDRFEAASILHDNFVANSHFGGGILGSQAFLMQNTNLPSAVFPQDVSHINRRLTSRVFEDLLCHQMPSLTPADVQAETNAYVAQNSPHMFQRDVTCMQCHSSIDGMGYAMRNLVRYTTAGNPQLGVQELGMNFSGFLRLPAVSGATTFALQPPTGRLHYRELFTRSRKDMAISSLAQLGTALSQQNDIYYCAAKRYYKFLTGIDVDMNTPATTGSLDRKHQDQVKALGDALKSNQSVRTLLHNIFKSDVYRTRNFRSVEDQ